MMVIWLLLLTAASATENPVIYKLDEPRFQYIADDEGTAHLVDLWVKVSDLAEAAYYDPEQENNYILFTRMNPSKGQHIFFGNTTSLSSSNFDPRRRTVVLIHGWRNNRSSTIFKLLVPAFLTAEDVNVVVVDWSAGAGTINYAVAVANTVTSGMSVARFISWLNSVSRASLSDYHLAGHSLGGHQAGVVSRNLGKQVGYITALDPAFPGWVFNKNKFKADHGVYTEVIHTNAAVLGYPMTLGQVDFYPNKGFTQPGCVYDICSHSRAYEYFAESLTNGGFVGDRCGSVWWAWNGDCIERGSLNMGGVRPKTGQTGIFYMETNAFPPFSRT